jgi:hypothetical protein
MMQLRRFYFEIPQFNIYNWVDAFGPTDAKQIAFDRLGPYYRFIKWRQPMEAKEVQLPTLNGAN